MRRHERGQVLRWVITNISVARGTEGMRTLTLPSQGRHTFASKEEAEAELDLFSGSEGLCRVLSPAQMASLEVRECWCWDGGNVFDPVGVWFD